MTNYKFGKDYSFLALDLGTANTVAYVSQAKESFTMNLLLWRMIL